MGIHIIAHDCLALSTTSLPPTTRSTGIGGEAWQRVKRDRAVLASTLEKNLHHRLVLANARRPGNIVLHIECVRCSRCGSGTILHPSAMDGHENGEEDHGVRDSVPWEVRCILKFVKESHEPIELPSSRCCFVGY